MYKRAQLFAIAVTASLAAAVPVAATTITQQFTGSAQYASWEASLTGSPAGSLPSSLSGPNSDRQGTTADGFTFSGAYMTDDGTNLYASSITITTPATGETAMFFDITGTTSNYTLEVNAGTSSQQILTVSPFGYFGFDASVPITSVTVSSSSQLELSFFQYGTNNAGGNPQSPTPEAATFLLTCGGLLLLFGSGRKLIHKAAF